MDLRQAAEILVRDHLASGERIPGLHQPQHTDGDPRASVMIAKAKELGIAGAYSELQSEIVTAYSNATQRQLHINVLGAAGSALLDMGFSPNACWAIGILSRAFSCAAHAIEEMEEEAAWRATSSDGKVNILSLSLQGERYYHGEGQRPVPPLKR
jgi:citrate synthase